MLIFIVKNLKPTEVSITNNLFNVPHLPLRSTVTVISPLAFGSRGHGSAGNRAIVQPQDERTDLINTRAAELFVTPMLNTALVSPGLELYSMGVGVQVTPVESLLLEVVGGVISG